MQAGLAEAALGSSPGANTEGLACQVVGFRLHRWDIGVGVFFKSSIVKSVIAHFVYKEKEML